MTDFAETLAHALETGWPNVARPSQLPPPGDWTIWLLLGGRGAGKTRSLCEWVCSAVAQGARRVALVGPTAHDTRAVLVEGASGIIAIAPNWNRPLYNPALRRLTWPNGAIATLYSADEPERLRGPNHDLAAVDELCAWRYPAAWDMLMFGLRLGERPRCAIATTPKPTKLLKTLLLREGHDLVVSRSTSYENRANLAESFFGQIIKRYEGTRLGRQELEAEVLDDVPGALWNRDRIEELRREEAPRMSRIVVAIDPAGSAEGDETGIIAAGVDEAGHGWVLADDSGQHQPTDWARFAVELYRDLRADRVVAETNFGGGMVEATIRAVDPNVSFRAVTASRGKVARAEPISALYQQRRVHHLGVYPELEDQLCSFTSHFDRSRAGFSPGRLDALVWALTDLMALPMDSFGAFEYARQQAQVSSQPDYSTAAYRDALAEGVKRIVSRNPAMYGTRASGSRTGPLAPSSSATWAPPTPDHPECRGGAVEYTNGPRARLTYAIGSLEWQEEQERLRRGGGA